MYLSARKDTFLSRSVIRTKNVWRKMAQEQWEGIEKFWENDIFQCAFPTALIQNTFQAVITILTTVTNTVKRCIP